MINCIQKGDIIIVTTPGGGYTSGQLVTVGELVGIAQNTTLVGETAAINMSGVFEVPKATGAITIGAILYHDTVAGNVTTTAGSLKVAGYAFAAQASGDATVQVRLRY